MQWSYRYWRAELRRCDAQDDGDRLAYAASLSRTHRDDPEEVAWWIRIDDAGAIVDAGWRSAPPILDLDDVDLGAELGATANPLIIDDDVARRLFEDD